MNRPVDASAPRVDARPAAAPEADGAATAPGADRTDVAEPELLLRAAMTQWRRQAADLGGRNPLLWYRDMPTGTFDLTVAHPGGVAKVLAGVPTLLSELVREQVALAEARRRVRAIRAKTVELHRGHGLTTAFIAVGMATWRIRRAPVPPRAPVLLRACTITPTDAAHADFTITLDLDVVFNPVLAHYLGTELDLPVDPEALVARSLQGSGFDPRPTYQALEQLCAGLDGFGIGPQLVVSTFPWAKLPFVAALSADPGPLASSGVIAALAGAPRLGDVPDIPEDLDAEAADDPSVLDSDRAQRRAIAAARQGHSFVIDAPPGTGRTQTIANIVADRLGRGGTVLVLAEHAPALADLRRRLSATGLGDRVLTLRETPSGARAMATQLRASLPEDRGAAAVAQEAEADTTSALVEAGRLLAEHQAVMHEPHPPWDVALVHGQEALTELAARPRPPLSHVRLGSQTLTELLPARRDQVVADLVRAAEIGAWQRGRTDDPWYGARLADEEEAARAEAIVQRLVGGELSQARQEVARVCGVAGLPEPLNLKQWAQALDLMGQAHETLDVFRPEIYESALEELAAAVDRDTDPRPSAVARARAKRQIRALLRPGAPPADLAERVIAARDQWAAWESLAGRAARPAAVAGWQECAEAFERIDADLTWLGQVLRETPAGRDLHTTHLDLLLERLLRLDARTDRLSVAAQAHALLEPIRQAGLGQLLDDLALRGVGADDVPAEVEFVWWASLLDHLGREREGAHNGPGLREAVSDYAAADRAHLSANAARVGAALRQRADEVARSQPGQVQALRESGPHPARSTRRWLAEIGDLAQGIRPCWLASPVVVPATVPAGVSFDLVVVDEASRVPVPHVVSGLALGSQVVVVGCSGDPAPRPFVSVVDERAEAAAAQDDPAPSLLAQLSEHLPVLSLDTDYQTIDERLRLALQELDPPVRSHGFPGVLRSPRVTLLGETDGGSAIHDAVDLVIEHARTRAWQSLAVLTEDERSAAALDQALRDRIGAEGLGRAFREEAAEALVLGPLGRAGGLVRDRVMLVLPAEPSLTAAEAAAALALARRSVTIVAAGEPDWWPNDAGPAVLRRALELAGTTPGRDDFGSHLLADLARRLRAEGLVVRGSYGVGHHRLDLVVDDPEDPGRALLAVRTDAQPWPPSGRDSIRLIHEQLRRLGWATELVWCTDLFRDPAREVARLLQATREASLARARR